MTDFRTDLTGRFQFIRLWLGVIGRIRWFGLVRLKIRPLVCVVGGLLVWSWKNGFLILVIFVVVGSVVIGFGITGIGSNQGRWVCGRGKGWCGRLGKETSLMSEKHALKIGKGQIVIEGGGDGKVEVVVFGGKAGENGLNEVFLWNRVANK